MNLLVFILAFFLAGGSDRDLTIQAGKDARQVKVVARLPGDLAKKLPAGKLAQEQGERWLRLSLVDAKTGKDGPAMFGRYQRLGQKLSFRPSFALSPKRTYRAVFQTGAGNKRTATYIVPAPKPTPVTVVTKIYPTAKVLPANNLKFYIYFSQPMRGGKEIFDQIYLVDDKGNKIHAPWLMDELWDEADRRLIIFIHPGRIKWGLLLRRLFGPVLFPGRRYTLVINRKMLDRHGQQLKKDYKYSFRTSKEFRSRIDLAKWQVTLPAAGTRDRVAFAAPQPLDHMSITRFLTIVDANGKKVAGAFKLAKGEKNWSFEPKQRWSATEYALKINSRFEDVAGNTPLTAFDRDATQPAPPPQRLSVSFRPGKRQ